MIKTTRSIDKQTFWSEQIAAWEASDLSQPHFCEKNNISYSAFGYWRTRLKKQNTAEQAIEPCRFLPVNINNHNNPFLTLKINNVHSIDLSPGFDVVLLS